MKKLDFRKRPLKKPELSAEDKKLIDAYDGPVTKCPPSNYYTTHKVGSRLSMTSSAGKVRGMSGA